MTRLSDSEQRKDAESRRVPDEGRAGRRPGHNATAASSSRSWLIGGLILAIIVVAGIATALFLPRALADGPANLSCLDERLDGFFDPPAATEEEVDFQDRLEEYATELAGFSCDEGHDLSGFKDPVDGGWMGEEGFFTFSQDEFVWSIALEDDDTEYYFSGEYTWLPGCEFEQVLQMERRDRPCYTVFLRYEETMSSDVLSNDVYYGGLMIAQNGGEGSAEQISMFNMRTGGSFYVDRLE